jgi:16S rRNA (uracil1498-N3)-methyltransferase
MSRRFFVDLPVDSDAATLTGPEAHHLVNVMRGQVGDRVALFDGSGFEFDAEITDVGRSTIELKIVDRREVDRELALRLTVGVAIPKGDRQRWLIEKLVELGVTKLVPLVTSRSVVQPSGKALDRLRRAVIEASKQCGRNRLMEIAEANRITDYLSSVPGNTIALFAHPAEDIAPAPRTIPSDGCDVMIAVGPEGGFTDDEVALAGQHDWRSVSFGPRILRTETAAVALASLIALQRV